MISQAFLNNILAFQMSGTFSLATRPILLNIVINGVFSEAGLKIPIKISGINKYAGMNYSKTQYIAMQCSAILYCLYHSQFPAKYRVLSSEAQVPILDLAVYSGLIIPATPPKSQSRQGLEQLDPQLGDSGWQESLTLALHHRATRG